MTPRRAKHPGGAATVLCRPDRLPPGKDTMTSNMRDVLSDASKNALRRIHDTQGAPPWPAAANTLRALVKAGYVEYTELVSRTGNRVELWKITPLGEEALKGDTWTAEERLAYLAPGAGFTSDHSRSVDWDPRMGAVPTVDAGQLSVRWRRVSALERVGAQDSRQAASRVARSLKAA